MRRRALLSLTVATTLVGGLSLAQEPPATPPPIYYVEPPPARPPAPPRKNEPPPVEPPIPGQAPLVVWEPPPPPEPRHVAPRTSLWVGARTGWFLPFGYLLARAIETSNGFVRYDRVAWRDYAGSGPFFEVDIGARLSRNYNLFALWEHAELAAGNASPDIFSGSPQQRGDTDFWGLGVRASSDADGIGFASELALGYRRADTPYRDGSRLELESGFLEARLGLGADIRVSRAFSVSPLLTLGVGTFSDVDFFDADGRRVDRLGRADEYDGHGWLTLQLGAHLDAFGAQ